MLQANLSIVQYVIEKFGGSSADLKVIESHVNRLNENFNNCELVLKPVKSQYFKNQQEKDVKPLDISAFLKFNLFLRKVESRQEE